MIFLETFGFSIFKRVNNSEISDISQNLLIIDYLKRKKEERKKERLTKKYLISGRDFIQIKKSTKHPRTLSEISCNNGDKTASFPFFLKKNFY